MVNVEMLLNIGYKILKTNEIITATEFSYDAKEVERIMQEVKAKLIEDLISEYNDPTPILTTDDVFNTSVFEEPKKATVAKKTTVGKKAATTGRNTSKK